MRVSLSNLAHFAAKSVILRLKGRYGQALKENMNPIELLKKLHTTDLYLALACSQRTEKARNRFIEVYDDYLLQVAKACAPSRRAAEELAGRVLAYLFAPDASGELPFARYDARISLAGWLVLIVKRMSIREESGQSANPGSLARAKSTPKALRITPPSCLSEEDLGGYLSNLVNEKERRRLQSHLIACKECREVIAFYTKRKDKLAVVLPSELR
jgi:hypothetical protein